MVLHNPNNWHWVNKDVKDWALDYLEKSLVGTSAQEGDVSAKVSKIMSMDGDVDVSQRKGKVITLFDVKLQMEYEGDDVLQLVWGPSTDGLQARRKMPRMLVEQSQCRR